MDEEEILELSPAERLKVYLQQMQDSRELHIKNKIEQKALAQAAKKQEKFQKKQKECKFDIDPKSRPHWKLGERHTAKEFDEKSKKYLPITDIHATELYRSSHLIPRSYKYPEKPFKLTKNNGEKFGETNIDEVLSESGKKIIQNNIKKFEEEVERRRQEELKLKTVEFGPRWKSNKTSGDFFSVPPNDPYYFFKKDMKEEYYQEKPFLRTSKHGDIFSYP